MQRHIHTEPDIDRLIHAYIHTHTDRESYIQHIHTYRNTNKTHIHTYIHTG